MPPRVARSSVPVAKPQNARKKSQKRTLDAFSIASHSAPDKLRIKQHRLGETEGEPRQKRRRLQDDDQDGDDDDGDDHGRKQPAKGAVKRSAGPYDDVDEGSDSEGNEWRMGGPIGDDSDSSLDSDEAFGESDEDRFEGFTFRGSSKPKGPAKKKQKKPKPVSASYDMDLDEGSEADDDDGDDDDFGDEGVDLATMLDDDSDDGEDSRPRKSPAAHASADGGDDSADEEDDDDEGDDEEEEDESSDEAPSEAESDDADPTKLSKLQDLIASLEQDPPEKRAASRREDVNESRQPSAFGLSATQKLKISDLLPTVTDPALRKSLKLLSSDKPSKRSGIPGKLDAPLPKRQQDRLDRAAASQKAKETLDRWRDTVVHNRRAEFLQFPLKDPNASEALGTNKMMPTQQDKPGNELESAIQNILEESGLSTKQNPASEENQLQQFEELQMKQIPLDEVMARRAELRKARELLFREEVKAKRIKKIKSKSYRRVHRRERERAEAAERDFFEAEGGEPDEDEKERNDRRRAEERMGTKHRDSKWAKAMKKSGRTVWDDDARDGVVDMARRNEELRRRIEGKDVREPDSDDSDISEEEDDDDDDDMQDDEAAGRKKLSKQLGRLENGGNEEHSKLGSMLFMQRAEASRKAQNDEDIERMRRELAGEDSPIEEEDTAVGRRSFGPKTKNDAPQKPKSVRGELEEQPASDEEDHRDRDDAGITKDAPVNKSTTQRKKPKSFLKSTDKVIPDDEKETNANDDSNPWLTGSTKSKKRSKKQGDEELLDPSKAAPSKNVQQETPASQPKKEKKSIARQTAAPSTDGWTTVPYTNGASKDETSDGEDIEDNLMVSAKDSQAMYHQRAFAGDDVAVDFEAEKAAQMQEEDDQVVSTHLPGWGSWAGDGLSKSAKRQNQRNAHNPLRKQVVEGVKAGNRKDANLRNVVISEAQQRKSKKYLASQLPHQFEKREQYERSLRIPVGPEWTTKETFQRNTRPRVVVKQGIVAPMEKPLF
ncbi:hypothetical protein MBLNU459_g1067t1 [Dothideomycetes sp. NU459]